MRTTVRIFRDVVFNVKASHFRWHTTAIVSFAFVAACWAIPQAFSQATKDSPAVLVVQNALASMGGVPAMSAIQDAIVTGTTVVAAGQTASPQFTWKTIGTAVRCETTAQGGTSVFAAQNGTGFVQDSSGSVSAMDSRLANSVFPEDLPGIELLYLLSAADRTLEVISDDSSDGSIVHMRSVQVDESGDPLSETQQDWFFSSNTGLPIRVEYIVPEVSGTDQTGTIQFSTWQKTSTILTPQRIDVSNGNDPPNSISLDAPLFNSGLSIQIFQLP